MQSSVRQFPTASAGEERARGIVRSVCGGTLTWRHFCCARSTTSATESPDSTFKPWSMASMRREIRQCDIGRPRGVEVQGRNAKRRVFPFHYSRGCGDVVGGRKQFLKRCRVAIDQIRKDRALEKGTGAERKSIEATRSLEVDFEGQVRGNIDD